LAAAFSLKISATFSRKWIAVFAVASCVGTVGFRFLAAVALRRLADSPLFHRRVAIAGSEPQLVAILEFLNRANPAFISVIGIFADDPKSMQGKLGNVACLGGLDDVVPYARTHSVDDVIIALPWSADRQMIDLLGALRELAVNAYLGADLIGFRLRFRRPPSHFGEIPIFEVLDNPLGGWNGVIKSVEDYALAIVASVVLLPLMLLIAVAIKFDTPGPVLFRQQRIGFLNQRFRIHKFRTMRHKPSTSTTVQAKPNDPRVTRVGRILRRFSLDELPNLINVLNGTMSIVGPRPHALDHNQEFSKTVTDYFVRHRIKPGMTGWAQVNGLRGATDTPEKIEARVRYDIYYAENWSLWLDLKILLMTLVIVLTGRNAY
jgi:putative colanic acid biosynthesis UDP-glucose lipid carrier transferase